MARIMAPVHFRLWRTDTVFRRSAPQSSEVQSGSTPGRPQAVDSVGRRGPAQAILPLGVSRVGPNDQVSYLATVAMGFAVVWVQGGVPQLFGSSSLAMLLVAVLTGAVTYALAGLALWKFGIGPPSGDVFLIEFLKSKR